MNSVALGFRDDITDVELDALMARGVVFECSQHGVYESSVEDAVLDEAIDTMREKADG